MAQSAAHNLDPTRRATYQDVLDAPGRRDRRRDAPHPAAVGSHDFANSRPSRA